MTGLTSSKPITPAPITSNLGGTDSKDRAPVDEIIVFSSNWERESKHTHKLWYNHLHLVQEMV